MTTLDDPAVILGTAGEYDEDWEFDAPRYHDFQNGTPVGQSADRWFETSATKGQTMTVLVSLGKSEICFSLFSQFTVVVCAGLASPDASKPASKETSTVSMKPLSQQVRMLELFLVLFFHFNSHPSLFSSSIFLLPECFSERCREQDAQAGGPEESFQQTCCWRG